MEVGLNSLPDSINPSNFPAKLWRLVNNPAYNAIFWDRQGEVILIDQQLFEKEVLSPRIMTSASPDTFKTTNFSSFVRQLNLYGFKKDDSRRDLDSKTYQSFYNPNFKRDQPELVARLWRLTVNNKAKVQAGLNIKCRPPRQYQRPYGDDRGKCMRRVSSEGSLLLSSTNQKATPPHYPCKTQAYTGTPIPPRFLTRGAALPSSLFSSGKELLVHLNHPDTGVNSSSNAVHIQQNTNHGSPNFTSYRTCNAQHQPVDYSPPCHCYHPNLVAPHMAGGGLQTGLLSPQSDFQAGYPISRLCCKDNNQCLQKNENQEVKNCEMDLDLVFKIADETVLIPPNASLVKVEPQDEVVTELESSSSTCDSVSYL